MWALLCAAAPFVCAQITEDSLEVMLDEVAVVAKAMTARADRRVIIPPRSKVEASASGLELLQKLALPGITVNRLTGSINLSSGGVIGLYIDGVPATESQIAVLNPEDIIRIEYHDNPGVRYGHADAVLDYVTRRRVSGGRLYVESMDCIGNGKFATIDEIAGQIHRGKSSWSVNVGYMQMSRNNWVRDYEEVWRYPDHDVMRSERGLPVKVGMSMLSGDINYRYDYNESNAFNARFSLNRNASPYKEEGDRHSLLTTSDSQDVTEIREHTAEESLQPTLALSYRHVFGRGGTVKLNCEGAWLASGSRHEYSESSGDAVLCDILTRTDGEKYGIFAEGTHEIKLGAGLLTSGIRYSQSRTSNRYASYSGNTTTSIRQTEGAIYAEYNLSIAKWGLIGGLTCSRMSASQGHIALSTYAALPNVTVSYKPHSDVFLRYNIRLTRKLPPLASMSDVSQEIHPEMLRQGNPHVKPFSAMSQDFVLSYGGKYVGLNLSVDYMDETKPVMSGVEYDEVGRRFIQTYRNQKYFRRLQGEAMIRITPCGDYLTLWVAPHFARYFSKGYGYNLAKNIFLVHFGADVAYRHFVFTASTMSGPENYMYGDEIIMEKPMNMILAGYKGKRWSAQAGVFNLMKSYWMKTENFSPLTPFSSKAHCGRNTYFAVKLSVNLEYGRRGSAREAELPAESRLDMDAGMVSGLK